MRKIVLIAQRTIDARKQILHALEPFYEKDFYLLTCNSGQELLSKLSLGSSKPELGKPSMIFIDLHLHGINGLEILNIIRNNHDLADIPVISLASPIQGIFKVMSLSLNVSSFITRPSSTEKILEHAQRFAGVNQ